MKTFVRNHVTALFLMVPAAAALVALPTAAVAQQAPDIDSFDVASDAGLRAGSQLRFKLEGTPRSQAQVRIRGASATIVLRETEPGVYRGRYTITRNDRIDENSAIRAMLRKRNKTVAGNYDFPRDIAMAGRPPLPTPPVTTMPLAVLKIDRFSVATVDRIEPGAELRFTLNGMPGATASFDIPGVASNVAMREVRPGIYEGAYTIRRMDNLTPSRPIVGTLRAGERVITANLAGPLVADARPPTIRNLAPREGEVIADNRVDSISGTFDDAGGVGVDPRSVRISVDGRDVTGDSQVNAQSFTYRSNLPPGRHSVDVSARDLAGNTVRRTWGFDVVGQVAAIPTSVPLQIVSHVNNAQVDGGSTLVRGRTAPGAFVDVKVQAIAPVAGLFNVAQEILSQRIQADPAGSFSFTFAPQFPVPGSRYEVTMVAHKADLRAESHLVLFQRNG